MDLTILQAISTLIENVGLTNTLISLILTIAVGWVYRNEHKQKKIKDDNATSQMANIVATGENQTAILHEVHRTVNGVKDVVQELSGKFDSTNGIATELMKELIKRNISDAHPDKGGN